MEVLVINGVDYSRYIEAKGVGWSRNDVDGKNATRTKDTRMRRDKLGTKRKVSYKLIDMKREQMAALDDALSEPTFRATYLDLHGKITKEFYCTSFQATLETLSGPDDPDGQWGNATFNMIEV